MERWFIQCFEKSFKDNWDFLAMVNYETKQSYKYSDLAKEIARMHIFFKELGIQQGDKIALVGNNSPEYAIVFLATITYGAVIVPILQTFTSKDHEDIINHSKSLLLFADDLYVDRLQNDRLCHIRAIFSLMDFSCKWRRDADESYSLDRNFLYSKFTKLYPNGFDKNDIRYDLSDDKLVILNYTSGTMNNNKVVMLSGGNFRCLFNFAKENEIGSRGKKFLSYLPLPHIMGYVSEVFLPLISGSNVVFLPKMPDTNKFIGVLKEEKPNFIAMVPLIIEFISKNLLLSSKNGAEIDIRRQFMEMLGGEINLIMIGGAALDIGIQRILSDNDIPYMFVYGMTECTAVISVDIRNTVVGSVGKVVEGVTVKIDSSDSKNVAGEILVKGSNVMMGYYLDESLTNNAFDRDGWFKTGDIGVFDDKGYLYVKGRCKAMILTSSGQNVYPEGIEAKLNNDARIKECLVVQRSNKIIALVYPNYDEIGKNVSEDELGKIMESCRIQINKKLASFEYINEFIIQDNELEKTSKGNIKRHLYT